MMVLEIKKTLEKLGNKKRAEKSLTFFKTGKGEYGEGDQFLGVSVPEQRKIAKQYWEIGLSDVKKLVLSKVHEHRLVGLFILVLKFEKNEGIERKKIVDFYLANRKGVNNWDLVDSSAYQILGKYLVEEVGGGKVGVSLLYDFAKKGNLWERRIAIVATFAFIRVGRFSEVLRVSEILVNDEEDLIHKAVGWMLREVGKKDVSVEEKFLEKWSKKMPRTMLRYAIERFPEKKRKRYMER